MAAAAGGGGFSGGGGSSGGGGAIGELVMELSPHDRERISAAIQAAERKTTGEIVCVLARHSADATALPILLAALAALALPWLLVGAHHAAGADHPLAAARAVRGAGGVLCLPRVRVALMPPGPRRAIAHRVAMEQFMLRGIGADRGPHRRPDLRLAGRALCAHHRRRGIAARVAQAEWQGAVDALIAHMRDGRIADGFVAAIERCGGVLATHFPRRRTSAANCRTGST